MDIVERLRAYVKDESGWDSIDETCEEAAEEITRLREALKQTLASLVAVTSLVIRAEDQKTRPSRAVASDTMFRQMLADYDNATIAARSALSSTHQREE